jgi:hypothetical protein
MCKASIRITRLRRELVVDLKQLARRARRWPMWEDEMYALLDET